MSKPDAHEVDLKSLADKAVAWLRAQGEQNIEVNLDKREIVLTNGEQSRVMFLGNLHREYSRAKPADRSSVLHKYLMGMREAQSGYDLSWDAARPRLVPVVRDIYHIAQLRLRYRSQAGEGALPAHRPLVGDMCVVLAIDQPNSLAMVPASQLEPWDKTFDECLSVAMDNLRAMTRQAKWAEIAAGVWSSAWNDSYDSSRFLLPELIKPLHLDKPVAMVPFREKLLVTSAVNPQSVALMAKLVQGMLDTSSRWLSFRLYGLDGNHWQPLQAPEAARAALHDLELHQLNTAYDNQAGLLQAQFEKDGTDIHVGGFRVAARKDEGPQSIGVWPPGVDSLLPQTDVVALSNFDPKAPSLALVPWAVVAAKLGHLMEATDYVPPRFRVRAFPSPDELAPLMAEYQVKPPAR